MVAIFSFDHGQVKTENKAVACPGFFNMKRLGVFLLPPGWDASPSKGFPQHSIRRYSFTHLGGERHRESNVSCPRIQPTVYRQGSNQSGDECSSHEATASWALF